MEIVQTNRTKAERRCASLLPNYVPWADRQPSFMRLPAAKDATPEQAAAFEDLCRIDLFVKALVISAKEQTDAHNPKLEV